MKREEKMEKKPFYKSKTKLAALLIGIGPVLATIGAMINGQIDFGNGLFALSTEIGIVLGIFGIRDFELFRGVKSK